MLIGGQCNCILGTEINGICNVITGCIQPVFDSQGNQVCLSCNLSSFHALPVNNQCQCLIGTLVNGICSTLAGCITPVIQNNGAQTCYFCKVLDNFQGQPASNGSCICKNYYELVGSRCEEICGDGRLFSINTSTCDDGNLIEGDGCNYRC